MASKEDLFLKKTDLEIKNYEIIKSTFTKIYEAESALYKEKKIVYDNLSNLQEENNSLNNIYNKVKSDMNELAESRINKLSKINSEVIPATVFYTSEIKRYKSYLGKYHPLPPNNAQQNNSESRNMIYLPGVDLDKDIGFYELNRIDNNKRIFLNYIHYELEYHTKAIEKLTELYKMIRNSKPKNDLKDFVEKYKLKKINIEDYGSEENAEDKKKKISIDSDTEDQNNIKNKEEDKSKVNEILNENEIGSKAEVI